jgi:hypothetical protein
MTAVSEKVTEIKEFVSQETYEAADRELRAYLIQWHKRFKLTYIETGELLEVASNDASHSQSLEYRFG